MELPIADFLSSYQTPGTRGSYGTALRAFLDAVHGPLRETTRGNLTPEDRARYEDLAAAYLAGDRNYADDIIRAIGRWTVAPRTAHVRVAAVAEFLTYHGIDLSDRDRKRIRSKLPRGGAVTRRGELTHEMLRAVAGHVDERGRALILVQASGGMRIGETIRVRLRDLDLDAAPPTIEIRPEFTKTQTGRTAFISTEAAEAVRAWLAVRNRYLAAAVERVSGCIPPKDPNDPRLFPFSINNAEETWARALAKAGLDERDERTGRLIRPLHSLRAFFASQLGLGCPQQVVEELLGHDGYLSDAYRRYSRQQLADAYLAAESHVTVLVPAEYKTLKSKVTERLQAHSEILESVVLENVQLKGRVQQLESQNATILEAAQVLKEISEHPRLREALRERE
jgi:integrase